MSGGRFAEWQFDFRTNVALCHQVFLSWFIDFAITVHRQFKSPFSILLKGLWSRITTTDHWSVISLKSVPKRCCRHLRTVWTIAQAPFAAAGCRFSLAVGARERKATVRLFWLNEAAMPTFDATVSTTGRALWLTVSTVTLSNAFLKLSKVCFAWSKGKVFYERVDPLRVSPKHPDCATQRFRACDIR